MSVQQQKRHRILWANFYCLLDSSSGASLSVREMLRQLARNGYDVAVIGATVFDSPRAASVLPDNWRQRFAVTDILDLDDPPLRHRLLMTGSPVRDLMTSIEESRWYEFYIHMLDSFRPDLVWFYGGRPIDYLIADEARHRGISVAAWLVNENYTKRRWCRDVDLILTDTEATADFYLDKLGLILKPVGKFIDAKAVLAGEHNRKHVLFVNPSLQKGAGIVIQLALYLEKRRPDIRFEVVESRGDWYPLLRYFSEKLGERRDRLENVTVSANTPDMRPLYSRARVVLAPSLWRESGSRVLAEAMINAIPAIVTDRGGNAELIAQGGVLVPLAERYHEKPYTALLDPDDLERFVEVLLRMFDDEVEYDRYVEYARQAGEVFRDISASTRKLIDAFEPLLDCVAERV
jgi:glycosyltransferase involved in cell wall biosynthesis